MSSPAAAPATVPTEGGRLYTRTLGESGPRIAFLHGVLGQGRNWTTIAKALVAGGRRATLIDLPNHGRSPWTAEFSHRDMTDAVAAELAALAPGEQWAIVGHSMGGKVAMMVALRFPELVERLVVVDVAPMSYGSVERGFTSIMEGMHRVDLGPTTTRESAEESLRPWIGSPTVRAFVLQNLRRDPNGGWMWQLNLDLLRHNLGPLGGWDIADVGPYEGPVLWLTGSDSEYVNDDAVPAMRALFPRTQRITVKNAGHWVHSEQPEVTLAALERFLPHEGPSH
ncbi:alpha/beta fold hydrolase [Kribbia dieselivorans]|uniref:alpha/beta fold hydrolase n=1 Tax=Kribbia dieselivorans TaxID=331526 RepID=UPI0008399EF2|nr:alpha/beta fold hydrolase [Kribbia dieselivorans]